MVRVRRYQYIKLRVMANLLRNAGKAIGYLGGGLTLITFAQGIQNNKQNKTIIENLNKRVEIQDNIISKYEAQLKKDIDYTKLTSKVIDINEETDKALKESEKLTEISTKMENTNLDPSQVEIFKKDISYHNGNLEESIFSSNLKLEELKNMLDEIFSSGSKNKFFGDNVIDNFQIYLSSLPIEKVGALGHILISVAILFSLITIITIFYGDSLIKYYNLEVKYPRLARFIQLRRKFQQYYFLLNIIIIILALLLIIYVNLIVFIN
jgi:hypothetical protein